MGFPVDLLINFWRQLMKNLPHRFIIIGITLVILATLIATTEGKAEVPQPPIDHPDWAGIDLPLGSISHISDSTLPPLPEQNPCLHCHIAGEIYWEWSPISRWFVFGAMVLTFSFGLSRNAIVWKTRERWQHRWMELFSKITVVLLILQLIIGIVLGILSAIETESLLGVITIIKAIHWWGGIAFFIAAMGLSFAGALLPGYQRPFWAAILIIGALGSSYAFAHLSFAYLYAEWSIPPSPARLFIFHTLLSPLAIAGIMSIYFMLRKRGEQS
jgi:hypothetical protein